MIRIALLDPYPVVHKGFKSFFKKTPHISMEKTFALTHDLFEFLKENSIDIIFCEMDLENQNPALIIERIKKEYPKTLGKHLKLRYIAVSYTHLKLPTNREV